MSTGILHFRVDDRMLHGIVATQWVPTSRATRAMVVDDAASTNDVVRASLKMACPPGVALSVISREKAITNIQSGKYANQRVFCVFRYIETAYDLWCAGVPMPQLNLGNVTQNTGEVTVLDKTVRISSEERDRLREMRDGGVKITVRFLPGDVEQDIGALLG